MELKTYTLRFASMDGQDGRLNLTIDNLAIVGKDFREAVQKANETIEKVKSLHHIPFMPQLIDSEGKLIAVTSPQFPYAHHLTWIEGSTVGSKEKWVELATVQKAKMTERRNEWMRRYEEELLMKSNHVYDERYLAICRDIVQKMTDPNYEPPSFDEMMKNAPWGP